MTDRIERARRAIAQVTAAGERLAQAAARVQELEDARPMIKSAAIRRLMTTTNEETQKPHSASSAEKIVESDAEYFAHRQLQRDAEVEKHRAYAAYEAARLDARLAVDLAGLMAGAA